MQNTPHLWKVLPFRLATATRLFTALTKPILFLCQCKGFTIVIYLDNILILTHLNSQLWHVIHSYMLIAYHNQAHIFSFEPFSFSAQHQVSGFLIYSRSQFLCNVQFTPCLLLQMPHPVIGPFIFRVLDCHYHLANPGEALSVMLISLSRTSGSCLDAA